VVGVRGFAAQTLLALGLEGRAFGLALAAAQIMLLDMDALIPPLDPRPAPSRGLSFGATSLPYFLQYLVDALASRGLLGIIDAPSSPSRD